MRFAGRPKGGRASRRSTDFQSVGQPVVPTGFPETAVGTTAGRTDCKSVLRTLRVLSDSEASRTARSAVPTIRILLIIALSVGITCARSFALDAGTDAPPAAEKKTEAKKIPYSPEVEAKFAEFLKKVKEAKGKVWTARMKKEIEEIAKVTGLNAEGAAALETAAKAPIASALNGWIEKLEALFRKEMPRAAAQLLPMFDQITMQIDMYANEEFGD